MAPGPVSGLDDEAVVSGCLEAGRRDHLRPYVPPPALLFVTELGGSAGTAPGSLASVGTARIVLVAAVIVLLTVGVSIILAILLVRPLRAVTGAARRMRHGELGARAAVRSKGELGELAQAFNEMAEHRERTERQRKAMVSDISHELRTPLGTMRSWLEAAKDGVFELDDVRLSSLLDEAIVLQHLVDDLQDLALVEAGKLRLHREVVDVGDLLEQVAAAHRDGTGPAAVILRTDVSGGVDVPADPVRLRQVVTNLVTNAVRHTPGGGTVSLSARYAGEHVEIEVSDTGVGIDAADLPMVFDRFWRADPSRTRVTGGSGLGLAIVHGLVTAHGGTVDVTSVRGSGSTFTVRLLR
jgi:two-component system, OmpR family, sensor histidine kinase BaeS